MIPEPWRGLAIVGFVLVTIALGMGWECARCGEHTGLLWPRACPRGCSFDPDAPTEPLDRIGP